VILSIGPAMRGSATLMQFRGAGHKLALSKDSRNDRRQLPIRETAQTTG